MLKQVTIVLLNATNLIIRVDRALKNKKANSDKSIIVLEEVLNNFLTFLIFCLFVLIFRIFLNFVLLISLRRQS